MQTPFFNPATFRTLQFLLLVIVNASAWILAATSYLPTRYGVLASAISAAGYALARGLAKVNRDTKAYWRTTEFWIAVAGSVPAVVGALDHVISKRTAGLLILTITLLLKISDGLRTPPAAGAGPAAAPPSA